MKKCIYCGVNDTRNERSYLCENRFKKQLEKIRNKKFKDYTFEDYMFLHEQAERVQELDSLIVSYQTELAIKNNALKRAKNKNKRYREAIKKGINATRYTNPEVAYILGEALEGEE